MKNLQYRMKKYFQLTVALVFYFTEEAYCAVINDPMSWNGLNRKAVT